MPGAVLSVSSESSLGGAAQGLDAQILRFRVEIGKRVLGQEHAKLPVAPIRPRLQFAWIKDFLRSNGVRRSFQAFDQPFLVLVGLQQFPGGFGPALLQVRGIILQLFP